MKSVDMLDGAWEEVLEDEPSHDIREEVQAANMLRALANPHRLKILKLLEQEPHNVMDLCERLSLRQSLASQHLARLRVDGIVQAERQGHHVIYSLKNPRAREILAVLEGADSRTAKASSRKRRTNGSLPSTRRTTP